MDFFAEQRRFDGSWTPVIFHDYKPLTAVVNGRTVLKRTDGQGPEIRAVAEISATKIGAGLAHLQAVLSPDGHLRGTQQSVSVGG